MGNSLAQAAGIKSVFGINIVPMSMSALIT